jgi:hypothetical protein
MIFASKSSPLSVDDIENYLLIVYDIEIEKFHCENCPDERIWYDAWGQGYCLHCTPEEAFEENEY